MPAPGVAPVFGNVVLTNTRNAAASTRIWNLIQPAAQLFAYGTRCCVY
jgi:hypothetical protein